MKFGGLLVLQLWAALCQECSCSQQSGSVSSQPFPTTTISTGATSSMILLQPSEDSSSVIEAPTTATVSFSPLAVSPSSSMAPSTTPNTNTVLPQTSASISTSEFLIAPTTSISLDSMVLMTETLVVTPTSSPPAPEVPSTEAPTTSFIDFVRDHSDGFGIVGASLFFVLTMCGCLVLVLCCRKPLIRRRQQRRHKKILENAGDVWIVNENATLGSDCPILNSPSNHHRAAAAVLQRPSDRALILSNPQASQSSLLQYHDIPDLTGSPALPTLSPMVSASGLILSPMSHHNSATQLLLGGAQNVPNPSAPPKHHI